jgi:hypothetical protein
VGRWDFAESVNKDDKERRAVLLAPTTFEAIVRQIERDMNILCSHLDPCTDGPDSYARFVACVHVTQPLFDLFFNAPHGYRAAYHHSPTASECLLHTVPLATAPVLERRAVPKNRSRLRQSVTPRTLGEGMAR